MLLSAETAQQRRDRVMQWRRWFAWRPVTITDGRMVWLETVERRVEFFYHVQAGGGVRWEYRRVATKGDTEDA